jgi:hypothetical protein
VEVEGDETAFSSALFKWPMDNSLWERVRARMFPWGVYARVAFIAAVMGVIGTHAVIRLVVKAEHGFEIPLSVLTWLLLVHLLDWRSTPWAIVKNIVIGALSPIVGCLIGAVIYVGWGLIFLYWVIPAYHIFLPFGVATAFIIYFVERRRLAEVRGFPVAPKAQDASPAQPKDGIRKRPSCKPSDPEETG